MKVQQFIFFYFIFLSLKSSVAIDTIALNQTLRDLVGEILVSANGRFELGFFSPRKSDKRYLGIWYTNVSQAVVWVANRNNPLNDSSGVVTITANGNIVIHSNKSENVIWSSNSFTSSNNPVLQLMNSGNLVVRDHNSGSYVWQSFDYPSDTLIPSMKLGWDSTTGRIWFLTAWKSLEDPSTGDFTYKLDHRGLPQTHLRKGAEIKYRSGPWDGASPNMKKLPVFKPVFVLNETRIYYTYENDRESIISRFVLSQSGILSHLVWIPSHNEWRTTLPGRTDLCDTYARCGPNGICNPQMTPICRCPTGFIPKIPEEWYLMDWSGGCVAKTPFNCSTLVGFMKFSKLKLPDNSYIMKNRPRLSPKECEETCLRNCSCSAYAITTYSSCVMWSGDLIDIKEYDEGGHQICIRMATSDIVYNKDGKSNMKTLALVTPVVFVFIAISCYLVWKRKTNRMTDHWLMNKDYDPGDGERDPELPLFDFGTIAAATNNFATSNKVGEGGFGPVYKGKLYTGQEIAVKTLSKDSGQGLKEFRNEVILIANLQHRNLVRLLGCCIYGEEKMLVYEYMPNGSLDSYIFNQNKGKWLSWKKRFDIIVGIARGLLYLHRDSRLRIIHRDLKASNILLDKDMNPKISDFGLARTFAGDQTEATTCRVMGTFGYMSPEYAIDGQFSVKSDVFSFGVLVLEIVSGRKNRGFCHPDHDLNLLGHAWRLRNEGRALELMDDASIGGPITASEVLRCIQVGLLCVQKSPADRPTMSFVLRMLDSEYPLPPQPKQPGYYTDRLLAKTVSNGKNLYSGNAVTITVLQGR